MSAAAPPPLSSDPLKPMYHARRRGSVSAEANLTPQLLSAAPKVFHDKSSEQRGRIMKAIENNLLFRHLEPELMQEVVDAMFEKPTPKDEKIIVQGDEGDYFYVVDSGSFDVYVGDKKVLNITAGGYFGELALMYNAPRAATVQAAEDAIVWGCDRVTFRRILMNQASAQRRLYETFLEKVPILAGLEAYERSTIADALEGVTFAKGDVIIKQGDTEADRFYIVERGTAKVHKDGEVVLELKETDYFGEIALLKSVPRQASVIADSDDFKAAYLTRGAFTRLIGPCQEVLARNTENYDEMAAKYKIEHGDAAAAVAEVTEVDEDDE